MADDYRLKQFLDMWERDVASGKTVSSLHDWTKQHGAEDDVRHENLAGQISALREDMAREKGRVEGERDARQSFTNEVQTGRHLLPTPEQIEAARAQYAHAAAAPASSPLVHVNVQTDRHHSHRTSALPPVLVKAFSSGAAKVAGLVAVAIFGAFVRHCVPVAIEAIQQHPPAPVTAPGLEPHK